MRATPVRIIRATVLLAAFALSIAPVVAERNLIRCAKLTAVDGDTIKCDGVNMRDMGDGEPFQSGYDAPETRRAKCAAEKALGHTAHKRMTQLIRTPGVEVYDSARLMADISAPLYGLSCRMAAVSAAY